MTFYANKCDRRLSWSHHPLMPSAEQVVATESRRLAASAEDFMGAMQCQPARCAEAFVMHQLAWDLAGLYRLVVTMDLEAHQPSRNPATNLG